MNDECRKAFEEWCKKNDLPWKRDYTDFFYTYHKTEVAWNTWKSAWSACGNGWVNVKERLPEMDRYVLWACESGFCFFSCISNSEGFAEMNKGMESSGGITHWKAITLPKGDE